MKPPRPRGIFLLPAFLGVFLLGALFAAFATAPTAIAPTALKPIPPEFTDKSLFLTAIMNATSTPAQMDALIAGISGITVPHHLLAIDLIADTFLLASRGPYDRVIVISPDHYNLGDTDISVASRNLSTVFGELTTDTGTVGRLTGLPFVSTADFFYREHGIEAELPFIKYYFPEAKIVAVAIKESATKDEIVSFTGALEKSVDKRTLIVQSTDFSHYLTAAAAGIKDQQTIAVLTGGDSDKLFLLDQPDNLDSIAAQYIQMRVQKDVFGAGPKIIAEKNSQDYTSKNLTSTTSYITQIYATPSEGSVASIAGPVTTTTTTTTTTTILAVGDIMLGRYVETLMGRYGQNYPFENLSGTFGGVNAAIGNLEGAITSDHIQTPTSSLAFSFAPAVTGVLSKNNFSVLSLANNHSFDFGKQGFLDTQQYLMNNSITPVGNPYATGEEYASTKIINGKKITFVGFNATNPYFPEKDATNLLESIKNKNPDTFLVVLVHWGEEYRLTENDSQRSLAHQFVDSGADLVLGTHPHVVEGIEKYNGKVIFYSLGNLVFDQYFSQETQEGLMVELQFNGSGIAYQLIPVESIRSQPKIMVPEKAAQWLDELSLRSDPSLKVEIQNGEIVGFLNDR